MTPRLALCITNAVVKPKSVFPRFFKEKYGFTFFGESLNPATYSHLTR